MKIRIKFAKYDSMKFISHLDVMRYFQKAMRRANVDIAYSEGFSPHQIMSFAAPLGLGLTSNGEYLDIEVHSSESSAEMMRRLNETMVEGMEVLSYRLLPENAKNAMSLVNAADYTVTYREGYKPDFDILDNFTKFITKETIFVIKKTKRSEVEKDIKPSIIKASFVDGKYKFKLDAGSASNLKPELVVKAFHEYMELELNEFALEIQRNEMYGLNEDKLTPLEDYATDIL